MTKWESYKRQQHQLIHRNVNKYVLDQNAQVLFNFKLCWLQVKKNFNLNNRDEIQPQNNENSSLKWSKPGEKKPTGFNKIHWYDKIQ